MYESFYWSLYRIRRVEEEIIKIYASDKIKSPVHLSIGQEAVAVGVCQSLTPEDIVFGSYRSHALYLAKGGDLKKMIAELYGKVTGCSKGKGGSMHLADVNNGVMGTSAIVGTPIANAVGYAYGLKYQRKSFVVVCFFGDGAVDEGVFYESMNFAALKKLPVIFICENNRYAIHSYQLNRQSNDNIVGRAQAFGINARRIEDNDTMKIYGNMVNAIKEIKENNAAPFLFECLTYRWREHVGPNEDFDLGYRSRSDAEKWIQRDQLAYLGSIIDPKRKIEIESEIESEIRMAFDFAENSSFPDAEELYRDVFKGE